MADVNELEGALRELVGSIDEQKEDRRDHAGFYCWMALLQAAAIIVANLLPRPMSWGLVAVAIIVWGFLTAAFLQTARALEESLDEIVDTCTEVVESFKQAEGGEDVQN